MGNGGSCPTIEVDVRYRKLNSFFADYLHTLSKGRTVVRARAPLRPGTRFAIRLLVPGCEPFRVTGEVTREKTGEVTREKTGEVTREKTGEVTREKTGEVTREKTGEVATGKTTEAEMRQASGQGEVRVLIELVWGAAPEDRATFDERVRRLMEGSLGADLTGRLLAMTAATG